MVNNSYAQFEDDDGYLKVSSGEGEEFIELPKEDDDSVLFSFIQSQFPDAIGLKYNDGSGFCKIIKPVDDVLNPPEKGWGCEIHYIALNDENNNLQCDKVKESADMCPKPTARSVSTINKKQKKDSDGKSNDKERKIPDLMSVDVSHCKLKEKDVNIGGGDHDLSNSTGDLMIDSDAVRDEVTIDLTSEHFPSLNENPIFMHMESYCTSESGDDLSSKMKYCDKVDYLMEMFPDVPEVQLRRCLSRSKSNVEKAVAAILSSRNAGSKKVIKEKEQLPPPEEVEKMEKEIAKLIEMFPRLSECRIRDRYHVVGNNTERAMRVILQEEQSRANGYLGKNFEIHKTSFKKTELSEQDQFKLKQETLSKYFYMVDDQEKEHRPVILGKKAGSTKIGISDKEEKSLNVNNSTDSCNACNNEESKVEIKQSNNPKLNRKQRYR